MTDARGLYETLGVRPDASAAEIRAAYRALARRHHPDHAPADAAAMAAINEAYRVLGEPARRAVYDASLRSGGSAVAAQPRFAPADRAPPVRAPLPPARYPWRLVIAMFLVGTAIVLVGAALYEPRQPAPPDNLIEPGSCVVLEPNGDAREVNCRGDPAELVVTTLVAMDGRCPDQSEAHRDRQGRGLACITASSVP